MSERCFACNRKLGKSPQLVDTRDDQLVYVGRECFKLIKTAGEQGYQPPLGGPRLFLLPPHKAECGVNFFNQRTGNDFPCDCRM